MLAIKKYLLFAFLLENVMVQSSLLNMYSNYFFYPFLAIGLLCMFDSRLWSGEAMAKFGCLYALMGVYVFYEFVIGSEYISEKTLLYLLAKIVTFVIIITGLTYNESFYRGKVFIWLAWVMAFFVVHSVVTGSIINVHGSGRLSAGFTNVNTTGGMGAMIVGITVFATKGRRWTISAIVLVTIGFYAVLAGASRGGFLMLGLVIFSRYGFNIKTVGLVLLVVVLGLYIFPLIGLDTIGIQRMMNTVDGVEGTNRDMEREAAEWMIAQRPWTGWGFMAGNVGYAYMLVKNMGPHNVILEVFKQMGYPMGIVFFIIILVAIVRYWMVKRKYKLRMDLFFAMVLVMIARSMYESLFIGVHEIETNMLFLCLAILSLKTYEIPKKYARSKY